jgi:hypothetical protein
MTEKQMEGQCVGGKRIPNFPGHLTAVHKYVAKKRNNIVKIYYTPSFSFW